MSMISRLSLFLIRLYQKTWFLRQPSCRFYPSCSQYTATSVERFGFFAGLFAGCLRILRCHPFHPGGVDKVPERFSDLLKSDLLKVDGLVRSQVRLDACCEAERHENFNFIPGMRGTRTRGER